jgi:hypothetical protein
MATASSKKKSDCLNMFLPRLFVKKSDGCKHAACNGYASKSSHSAMT